MPDRAHERAGAERDRAARAPSGRILVLPSRSSAARRGGGRRAPSPTDNGVVERRDQPAEGLRHLRAAYGQAVREQRQIQSALDRLAEHSRQIETRLHHLHAQLARLEPGPSWARSRLTAAQPAQRASGPAGALSAQLLGAFSLQLDGRSVDVGTSRRGRVLLKYLLTRATARRATKEQLAELLWPDARYEQALTSLQAAVYQVRKAAAASHAALVRDPLIVFADDQYLLNPRLSVETDLDQLRLLTLRARALFAQGRGEPAVEALEAAVALYRGPLLPEEPYEDWVVEERDALAVEMTVAMGRLAERALERCDHTTAAERARQALRIDPTVEAMYRVLMQSLTQLGQRAEAQRVYQRCRSVLRDQVGVGPQPETVELSRRLIGERSA